jgi:hypothetical protein
MLFSGYIFTGDNHKGITNVFYGND